MEWTHCESQPSGLKKPCPSLELECTGRPHTEKAYVATLLVMMGGLTNRYVYVECKNCGECNRPLHSV